MTRRRILTVLFVASFSLNAAVIRAQIATVTPVPPASLQKLLPSVEGWTPGTVRAQQVVLSPEATYTFASVSLTKGDLRVRLQLSDTGRSPEGLTALAMIVISMPPDFEEDVSGTRFKRTKIGSWPAAEAWESAKGAGEITVVVDGRFVVTVDSSNCGALETLRDVLESIDLKSLASLK
jgi:hypothetical protein